MSLLLRVKEQREYVLAVLRNQSFRICPDQRLKHFSRKTPVNKVPGSVCSLIFFLHLQDSSCIPSHFLRSEASDPYIREK